MCLAIAMYLVTGTLSLLSHVIMALGIFLLTLLGKAILFVCASVYTVVPRPAGTRDSKMPPPQPFETMYPEIPYDFEEDYDTMARISLETVTSAENSSANNTPRPRMDVNGHRRNFVIRRSRRNST